MIAQRELEALHAAGYDPQVERFSLDQVFARSGLRSGEQAIYRVRGNPSMQSIKQLSIGLRNRAANRAYSGRIFLDELRLDEARNDPGLAAYAQLNTKLADFANLGGNVLWRQENFRSFTGQGGNSTDREAALSVSTNAQKLLPSSWGFLIPLKVNLSRSTSLPRFGPGSDVELTAEEKLEQQAVRSKEFYDVSISRRQGKNFFLRWTLDQMNLRLSHSREHSSDPVRPINEREAQTMNFNYSMPLPKPELRIMSWLPEFMPKGWTRMEFRPLPTSLTYAVNGSRRTSRLLRRGDDEPTHRRTLRSSKPMPLSSIRSLVYRPTTISKSTETCAKNSSPTSAALGARSGADKQPTWAFRCAWSRGWTKTTPSRPVTKSKMTQHSGAARPRSIQSAACRSIPLKSATRTTSPHA